VAAAGVVDAAPWTRDTRTALRDRCRVRATRGHAQLFIVHQIRHDTSPRKLPRTSISGFVSSGAWWRDRQRPGLQQHRQADSVEACLYTNRRGASKSVMGVAAPCFGGVVLLSFVVDANYGRVMHDAGSSIRLELPPYGRDRSTTVPPIWIPNSDCNAVTR